MCLSCIKGKAKTAFIHPKGSLIETKFAYNSEHFNYIKSEQSFGLKLDEAFLNYRIYSNPHNSTYQSLQLFNQHNEVIVSLVYSITSNKTAYIIHFYSAEKASKSEIEGFLVKWIKSDQIQNCSVIRFWGFTHCQQNQEELDVLSRFGFTFINKGISLVWLKVNPSLNLEAKNMVISRMASQGTD